MKADEPESDTHVPTNLTEDMLTNERYPAWSLDMATDTAKIAFWTAVRTGLGPDGPTRACYEPVRSMPAACWRKRQANATKWSPATVSGSLS